MSATSNVRAQAVPRLAPRPFDAREAALPRQIPLASHRLRVGLLVRSLFVDAAMCVLAHLAALSVFSWYHDFGFLDAFTTFGWSLVLSTILVVVIYTGLGLYKMEAYVSRPLHVLLILRAVVLATIIAAFLSFVLKSSLLIDSRLVIFTSFTLFVLLDAALRICWLDRLYQADARRRPGSTLVIAWGSTGMHLAARCHELRGFAQVNRLEPPDRRRHAGIVEPALLRGLAEIEPAPRQVIIDAASFRYEDVFDLIAAGRARGADVYIAGRSLGPLDVTRLLVRLFETPVMRVHRVPDPAAPLGWAKRAFDVVSAGAALVLLAPLFGVIALLIKRDSPGPVFFRQTRVGRGGRPFQFLKFRSMAVNNDAGRHRAATQSFIAGAEHDDLDRHDEWGRPLFKIADDDRVTRVGRVLRRYSLDELPQLVNVLRGEMSMVGPRPPLDYEVEQYKPWHHRRLEITPGITGLWQVAGRSRVAFDEMVFEDVIYACNDGLLTDIGLCVRTIPAALAGRGAA